MEVCVCATTTHVEAEEETEAGRKDDGFVVRTHMPHFPHRPLPHSASEGNKSTVESLGKRNRRRRAHVATTCATRQDVQLSPVIRNGWWQAGATLLQYSMINREQASRFRALTCKATLPCCNPRGKHTSSVKRNAEPQNTGCTAQNTVGTPVGPLARSRRGGALSPLLCARHPFLYPRVNPRHVCSVRAGA